ncbi:MAG TPA: cysteine--tRNA ligase, partial [Candidatus Saccharimonadales bacterium]|nr:cysteine--tRNA ligase [Candidatus Saccharimonadales bacterium]
PKDTKRDMEWESPWGRGFPGWHIECSAMSMRYLGETIDIHTGGIDHLPVHHPNEIAQSEAVTGKQFVRYWLHGNFITVDGTKLSKSLGNSYTLQDVKEHGFDPLDFRMFVLQTHYRSQADFTWQGMGAARTRRLRLQAVADLRFQLSGEGHPLGLSGQLDKIVAALSDDLGTPKALATLSEIESQLEAGQYPSKSNLLDFLRVIDELLGLNLLATHDITDQQKMLINEREEARQSGDYRRADEIRDELQDDHLIIKDTPLGPIWARV